MAIPVGINGFGRIGKCTFLQLLESNDFSIKAINTSFALTSIEQYINNDSVHGTRHYKVNVLDENHIEVKGHVIQVLNSRVPGPTLPFRDCGVRILFETTGAFLTTEKMLAFDVDYVVLSAPPKDIGTTPMYCYGVNENDYAGERIVSVASCTTNCIAPFLSAAQNIAGGIKEGNFLTVHAATASQSVTDVANDKNRTSRSIFNNMIPHSTGASKTVDVLIPALKGKIKGTSLRVPVSNVSMVDVNLRFNQEIDKEVFFTELSKSKYCPDVINVHKAKSVSGDFIGSYASSVVDYHQAFQLTSESLKFCLWYDNEWSFTNNMIMIARLMNEKNASKSITMLKDIEIKENDTVFMTCDLNHIFCEAIGSEPIKVIDHKVNSKLNDLIPTIQYIMNRKPSKFIIGSHVSRPFENNTDGPSNAISLKTVSILLSEQLKAQGIIKSDVTFLDKGLQSDISNDMNNIFLCENLNNIDSSSSAGMSHKIDIYVNESLSQSHQPCPIEALISCPIQCVGLKCGSDLLKVNELLSKDTPPSHEGSGKLKVAVIGGESPKKAIIAKLAETFDVILVSGATMTALKQDEQYANLVTNSDSLASKGSKGKIVALTDGFGTDSTASGGEPSYVRDINNAGGKSVYDMGPKSLNVIASYVDQADTVFWNGTLGKVEDELYTSGTENLVYLLKRACGGQVYITGDKTCSFAAQYDHHFNMLSIGSEALGVYLSTGTLVSIPFSS